MRIILWGVISIQLCLSGVAGAFHLKNVCARLLDSEAPGLGGLKNALILARQIEQRSKELDLYFRKLTPREFFEIARNVALEKALLDTNKERFFEGMSYQTAWGLFGIGLDSYFRRQKNNPNWQSAFWNAMSERLRLLQEYLLKFTKTTNVRTQRVCLLSWFEPFRMPVEELSMEALREFKLALDPHIDHALRIDFDRAERTILPNGDYTQYLELEREYLLTSYFDYYDLLEYLNPKPDEVIVELGAGYVRLQNVLRPRYRNPLVAYEYLHERIEVAARTREDQLHQDIDLREEDLRTATLARGRYYILYDPLGETILRRVLKELRQISKSGPITIVAIEGRGVLLPMLRSFGKGWLKEQKRTLPTTRVDLPFHFFDSVR